MARYSELGISKLIYVSFIAEDLTKSNTYHRTLAKASGVSPSTIVAIERGERPNPHPGTLGKLAKALEVSPVDLLED